MTHQFHTHWSFQTLIKKENHMADSKFTKGQERTFNKVKKALEELDNVVYVTPPKKKEK